MRLYYKRNRLNLGHLGHRWGLLHQENPVLPKHHYSHLPLEFPWVLSDLSSLWMLAQMGLSLQSNLWDQSHQRILLVQSALSTLLDPFDQ